MIRATLEKQELSFKTYVLISKSSKDSKDPQGAFTGVDGHLQGGVMEELTRCRQTQTLRVYMLEVCSCFRSRNGSQD